MSDWRANMAAALGERGCATPTEWAARFPGEHCWFEFKTPPDSCALCGVCKRGDGKPQAVCRGVVRITLREGGSA